MTMHPDNQPRPERTQRWQQVVLLLCFFFSGALFIEKAMAALPRTLGGTGYFDVLVADAGGPAFIATQGSFSSNAGNGVNGHQNTVNGARFDFGAGANDFCSSDGTIVTFAGPITSAGEVRSSGAEGDFRGLQINNNTYIPFINPTISAGFGTSPSVGSGGAGVGGFTITIGSGGTASTGTISFSATATTGWICDCTDITTPGGNDTKQTGGTTTTAVMGNFATTSGLAAAWTAGDVLRCRCSGY